MALLRRGFLLASVLFLGLAGCQSQDPDELGPLCLEDCELCTDEAGCVPDRCGILLIMSKDCEGHVLSAEIAVDQCLEGEELSPGSAVVTCATLKKGEERTIIVRSDDWLWQETVACTDENIGSLLPVALYCIAY